MMKRAFIFLYGVIVYLITLVTITYLIGFVGNLVVPVSLDGPLTRPFGEALLINFGLILLFVVQHTIMARRSFKDWWAKNLPKALERSTYVLASCICLLLLYRYWEPLGGVVWEVRDETATIILYSLFFLGWTIMFTATFLINHWDLFGLRQVYLHLVHRPHTMLDLKKPFLYKRVRHPLYLGFLIAFWATPVMTYTHLFFSLAMTLYILMGIFFEEKDLVQDFGERYIDYRRRVPMLLPFRLWRSLKKRTARSEAFFSRNSIQTDRN